MRWYHWIWIPVVVALAVVAYVLGRRDQDVAGSIKTELDVIEARTVAKRIQAENGAQDAAQWVERRHQNRMKHLDEMQRKKAKELRGDPVALAEFLVRAGK